ncbi:transmembrane protein 80-like isoform X1 [Coregonus clupeaformis]|uniref:Transmembrane protein 80 n=1 Tax=Coregonus suidteri TaxID=861788 RepID=A0AAN8QKU4_9TELE|nr:transmembrane protein 80-like isoform X1 [Coregonus clupeaformis]
MAVNRAGKSAVVLSSVPLQLLLYLSALYYVFYFLSTFCMIIYKSRVLSYPDDLLTQDVGLLFIMAGLELLRLYCGVRGNLQETEGYIWVNLAMTAATALLSVYFLVWQLYVMHADVIINSILLSVYGLGGVFGLVTLARFTSVYS